MSLQENSPAINPNDSERIELTREDRLEAINGFDPFTECPLADFEKISTRYKLTFTNGACIAVTKRELLGIGEFQRVAMDTGRVLEMPGKRDWSKLVTLLLGLLPPTERVESTPNREDVELVGDIIANFETRQCETLPAGALMYYTHDHTSPLYGEDYLKVKIALPDGTLAIPETVVSKAFTFTWGSRLEISTLRFALRELGYMPRSPVSFQFNGEPKTLRMRVKDGGFLNDA